MNYKCPTCGAPKLCGRLTKYTFFRINVLIDYEFTNKCNVCKTKWKSIARVGKGKQKNEYIKMEFLEIVPCQT